MNVWLFDIDGTLILSGGAGQKAAFATLEDEFNVAVQHNQISFAGRTDRAILRDLFQLHDVEETDANRRRFQRTYLKHLSRLLPATSGLVLSGVHELLGRLRNSHHTHLGLLTGNVRAGAEAKLKHYQLWDYFAFGGFGDMHVDRDHVAMEAFDRARHHAGPDLRPDHVWVVGDTVSDVRCAKAIGARAIAVATGGFTGEQLAAAEPDVLLDNLAPSTSLTQLLDEVASGRKKTG